MASQRRETTPPLLAQFDSTFDELEEQCRRRPHGLPPSTVTPIKRATTHLCKTCKLLARQSMKTLYRTPGRSVHGQIYDLLHEK